MEELKKQVEEWLLFCNRSYAVVTCQIYKCIINLLLEYIKRDGVQLTAGAIENFLDSKYRDGGSKSQFNTYKMIISSFCSWRQRRYGIENPTKSIPKVKIGKISPRVLSSEEYDTVINFAKGIEKDILCFLGNTGIRREEFRQLKWRNVSADMKFIKILGKGNKERLIPLNSTCREILQKYRRLDNEKPLQISARFPGIEGASFLCRKISKKTGVKKFGCHALRHYFSTELIRKGVSIYKVSKILGHSNVLITQAIYIHLIPTDLLGITDVLDN